MFFIPNASASPISQAQDRGRPALGEQAAGLLGLFNRCHRQIFDQLARKLTVKEHVGPSDGLGNSAGNLKVVVHLTPA